MADSKLDVLRQAEQGSLEPGDLMDLWGVVDAAETVWKELGNQTLMWNGQNIEHEVGALKFWLATQAALGGVNLQKTLFEY